MSDRVKVAFCSLNARLLLSYVAIILVCLILIGLGLLLFVRSSPLWQSASLIRLEAAARATVPMLLQTGPPEGMSLEQLRDLVGQIAEQQEVRVLLLDQEGTVRLDSDEEWEGQRLEEPLRVPVVRGHLRGVLTLSPRERWVFVGQSLPRPGGGRHIILFASPPARNLLLSWFGENLLPPLLEAGLVALVLSVLLAWLVTRSVAKPLQQVAAAAAAIAQGDMTQRAPVSGPQEAQDLARSFNHMVDQVATAQQAQQDLVANVSHELKTPLTSIQGFSQAILDGTVEDATGVQRAAEVIQEEAQRMHRMVDELLNLARFDAGQVRMAQEPVDVAALLARCTERLAPQAEASGIEVRLSLEEELVVTGDEDWLGQLFGNLLDNAIRHTEDGHIEVEARRAGGWVEATVTDSGEGIPAEDLHRVFERFYQADKSRRRRGGAGLGLSIAQEVAQLHGGELQVKSVVGLGSRFVVRLPARGPAGVTREVSLDSQRHNRGE